MGGIAGKDHPAVDEFVHAAALESVKRYPLEIEVAMPKHPRDPGPDIFRSLLDRRIGIGMELQIDTPDVIRLLVQKRGAPGVKRWIEPEPAFGRKFRRHLDVSNQKLILENFASEFRTHHLSQRGSRAVAGDDIVGTHPIAPVRSLD